MTVSGQANRHLCCQDKRKREEKRHTTKCQDCLETSWGFMRRQHHHPRIMKTYQLNCCSVTVSPFPFVWDCTNEILASRSPLLYDKGNGQRDVCSHSYFLLLCCEDWCPFSCRITLKADSWDKTVEKKRCEKQRNLLRKDEKNTLQNDFALTSTPNLYDCSSSSLFDFDEKEAKSRECLSFEKQALFQWIFDDTKRCATSTRLHNWRWRRD